MFNRSGLERETELVTVSQITVKLLVHHPHFEKQGSLAHGNTTNISPETQVEG